MDYIRLLFWLKWKLMWRGYARNTMSLVGVIIAVVFFLPIALGVAVGSAVAYRMLGAPWNGQLLCAVLLGIYLLWIMAPMLGYALNESYDLSRLILYPVSSRQVFIGAIAGSLMDFPVLLALPTLSAVMVGFVTSVPSVLFVLPALALFFFHTIAISQVLLLISASFLHSRRYRDIMMVLAPLIAAAWYFGFQMLPRHLFNANYRVFVHSRFWEVVNYLPSGLAARGIIAASHGDYLPAVGFLALLGLITVGTVYLAGILIDRVCTGAVVSGDVRTQRVKSTATISETKPARFALPPVVSAVVEKELKYYVRDPAFKAAAMQYLYSLVVWIVLILRPYAPQHRSLYSGAVMVWAFFFIAVMGQMQAVGNIFGSEGSAATTLFLFPSSRREIFLGKNLTMGATLLLINSVIACALVLLGKAVQLLPLLLICNVVAILLMIAAGNLVSVWFPMRMVMRGWRMQQQTAGQGCGRMLLFSGVFVCEALIMLPPFIALLLTYYLLPHVWFAVTIPLTLLYAGGLYILSLHLAVPKLMQREIEVIEKLAPKDE